METKIEAKEKVEVPPKMKVTKIGRYTIVQIYDETGKCGIGISRKSQRDPSDPNLGLNIARGRAIAALEAKQKGIELRGPFMG
jgi:hypothetical protein